LRFAAAILCRAEAHVNPVQKLPMQELAMIPFNEKK
jgi:hypothetical protein